MVRVVICGLCHLTSLTSLEHMHNSLKTVATAWKHYSYEVLTLCSYMSLMNIEWLGRFMHKNYKGLISLKNVAILL